MLLAFSQQNKKEMTFSELHRLTAMPRATAYRVVQTLEYLGFLQRHERHQTFSLGRNVLRLGFEYVSSLDLVQIGLPIIEQLRDKSQCSSHLAIRDGRDVVYIARASAVGTLINDVRVGTRLPVHQTSLGRMLLTDIKRQEFDAIYPENEFSDSGKNGLVTKEELWSLVEQDRQRGYVVGESFYYQGISSIVFPIFNRNKKIEGVTSILVPSGQIPSEKRESLVQDVQSAATMISRFLGM